MCAETTNKVEGLHSIRRKFVDKRLNYKVSYQCRVNMALLSAYLDNWQKLILEKVGLTVNYNTKKYFKVSSICCNIYILQMVSEKERVNQTTEMYVAEKYKTKSKKYQQ